MNDCSFPEWYNLCQKEMLNESSDAYTVFLFETPFNLRDDMLNCKSELTKEEKRWDTF